VAAEAHMKRILAKYKTILAQKGFVFSVLLGLLLLALSLGINYVTGTYASRIASNSVTDILLDHLPVMDVDFIFIQGFALFILFIFGLMLYEPKTIPFIFKSLALFIFIRSIFMSLTHIGPFPQQAPMESYRIVNLMNFTGDLFFSGHAGGPFLLALSFWRQKYVRLIFLAMSALFAVAVLLGHYHYSIDVFAAFFITYTIYHIAIKFFSKDYRLLMSENI